MANEDNSELVTWDDFKNILPLLLAFLSLGALIWSMKTDIRVLSVEVKNVNERLSDQGNLRDEKLLDHEDRIRELESETKP